MAIFDIFRKPKKSSQTDKVHNININTSELKQSSQAEIEADIIPVEDRMRSAILSRQSLFPHEILVLDYAETFYTDNNSFQGFWWYKYGVRDVQKLIISLVERDFLQPGNLREGINKQTATTIKEVLKANGLKKTGKKDELVQRALDEIPENILEIAFPRRTFSLTENGRIALDEAAYVPYIHRNEIEDLDIWSLNRLVHTEPDISFRDKIWGYLNQRSLKHVSEQNFGLYRNCRFKMSQFLKEEKKIRNALDMLAEVVFYDLSGATNNFNPQFLEIYADGFFPYENSLASTAPGIISAIVDCQKELGFSDDELKAALVAHMSELSVPIQLFSIDDCASIVFLEHNKDVDALTSMYAKAKQMFKKNYPNIKIK